jgi:hypothetical protein
MQEHTQELQFGVAVLPSILFETLCTLPQEISTALRRPLQHANWGNKT